MIPCAIVIVELTIAPFSYCQRGSPKSAPREQSIAADLVGNRTFGAVVPGLIPPEFTPAAARAHGGADQQVVLAGDISPVEQRVRGRGGIDRQDFQQLAIGCRDLPTLVMDRDIDCLIIGTPVAAITWHVVAIHLGDLPGPQDGPVVLIQRQQTMQALQKNASADRQGRWFASVAVCLVAGTRTADPLHQQVLGGAGPRQLFFPVMVVRRRPIDVRPDPGAFNRRSLQHAPALRTRAGGHLLVPDWRQRDVWIHRPDAGRAARSQQLLHAVGRDRPDVGRKQ